MALNALLLSAGLGTRLRPYTLVRPKPAIPFWGLPMSYYSLFLLSKAGTHNITMNLHHLPEVLKKMTLRSELQRFKFTFSEEKEKAMGSGGALYYAQSSLKSSESFFAINADEVMVPTTENILQDLANHHTTTKSLCTLLVTDHPDLMKTLKPVWINPQGQVRAFGDKPETTEVLRPVHYTGFKIFSKDVLPLIAEGETHIFHDVLVPAMKKGALVNTLFDNCHWWETGSFDHFLQAVCEVNGMIAKDPTDNHFANVHRFYDKEFAYTVEHSNERSVAIHKSSITHHVNLSKTVFIGEEVSFSQGLDIDNCIINSRSNIKTSVSSAMIFKEDV